MSSVFEDLQWRELVYDNTEHVPSLLAKEKITLYTGFDPTGDSLHVGHLVPMMSLARFQRFGHSPIALAGGGTGMIGDPSGRSSERNLLTSDQIEHNLRSIEKQLAMLIDFDVKSNPAKIVNNLDWLSKLTMIDFLRDIGKQFSVNVMLTKESVKNRLEGGISYTEFSYMLLQSYDFYHLHREHNCVLQAGGSDQWGNITAGTDLIRREGGKAHGLVYPLITKADGTKFGKTASGSVWLDPNKTSPYRFFQFWVNTDDRDVVGYLKKFTWLTKAEIQDLAQQLADAPHERAAHKTLAREMTKMIHGESGLSSAEKATEVLFGGSLDGLDAAAISDIFSEVPSTEIPKHDLEGGLNIADLLSNTSLATGKKDARRSIDGGGVYLNNNRIEASDRSLTIEDAVDGRFLVLRKGKRKYHLVKLLS